MRGLKVRHFIRRWGVEAQVYRQRHAEEEPYDCQLECQL